MLLANRWTDKQTLQQTNAIKNIKATTRTPTIGLLVVSKDYIDVHSSTEHCDRSIS